GRTAPHRPLPASPQCQVREDGAGNQRAGARVVAVVSVARQRPRAQPRDRARVLWSRGPTLDVEHLSLTSPDHGTAPAEAGAGAPALPPQGVDLAQWEKSMIERAMREAAGNQTKAAQRLGISRDTLRYRLKKFGLQH